MTTPEIQCWLEKTNPKSTVKFIGFGSDSKAFRVDDYVYRFPNNNAVLKQYETERDLCDFLRPYISAPIPKIAVHRGRISYAKHKMIMGRRWHWHSLMLCPIRQRHLGNGIARFFAELHGAGTSKIDAHSTRVEYVKFVDIAPRIAPFLSKRQMQFFENKYNAIVNRPVAKSDMVICHMGVKGSNSVIDKHGNLIGVFDFGNAGIHERWRDLSVVRMGKNGVLYRRVLRKYQKLTGIKCNRSRIADLGAIEHFTEKRWFNTDGTCRGIDERKIKIYVAKTMTHFYHLPRFMTRLVYITMPSHKCVEKSNKFD